MVSVVVPVRNGGATIGDQLAALAQQSVDRDWEVVVADNGSTDATRDVVKAWESRLPLRWVDASARRGPAAARNIGVEAAAGDLIAFTDADDIVCRGWLEAWLSLDETVHFATGPVVPFSNSDAVPVTRGEAPFNPPIHMGFLPYALGANMAIRRSLFCTVGGFREQWTTGEDVDLSWRVQLSGGTLTPVRSAVVAKRQRERSRTFRRCFEYGFSDPFLYREYRDRGLRRPAVPALAKTYLGLLARLVVLGDPVQRELWLTQLGRRCGRLVGSARARTFYP